MAEGVRVAPAFGGGTVKLLSVTKPMARVLRDAEGIHVLGWTIKLPADSTTQPADAPVNEAAPVLAEKTDDAPTPAAIPAPPGPEFKIEKLIVSGGDIVLRDVSVEPALVVPVNALDIEVKGLSNRALVENRTIRFSALVGTDKVELPTRARRGETAQAATELRPLMSQLTASGRLSLYPALDGYAKAAVNGFEMQSLTGEAKALGITLGDGIFDGAFDARFRDGGNLDLKANLVVTDLKMSEQPNGLVQRTLGLSAPIDAVIGLVQDPSGSITLPVGAKLRAGEVDVGSIVGSVVGGVAQVCVTAIASAPVKLFQGLGGGEKEQEPKPPIVLSFLPGDTSLEPSLRSALDSLIIDMKKDENLAVTLTPALSNADVSRAAVLASPTSEQIVEMTGVLRARRMMLMNDRAKGSGQVSAELASGGTSAQTLESLRSLDRQIVANDDALDRLLDLTRPGADLQAPRRTKATAIDIASARLEAIRSYLAAARIDRAAERISVVNPRFEVDESIEAGGTVVIDQIVKKRAK